MQGSCFDHHHISTTIEVVRVRKNQILESKKIGLLNAFMPVVWIPQRALEKSPLFIFLILSGSYDLKDC
jgi:hypothetical protein